jgi:Ca-activated chloride channel family protein
VRHPRIERLPLRGARIVEWLRRTLQLAALGLLIVALAQPRWPDEETRIPARSVAVQIVLDISGSMNEKDFMLDGEAVTRLDAARHALRLFMEGDGDTLQGRFDDLIGLITFAARVEQLCPPTLSHAMVRKLMDAAEPLGTPPDSTTNIGDAIARGIDLLQRAQPQQRVIILVSDGEHNVPAEAVPNALKPRQAARLAQALGIRIYTIAVGPLEGETRAEGITSDAKAAAEALQDVAELTGGQMFRAHDTAALLQACQAIDELERTSVESFAYYRYHEAYPWLGVGGVVCLLGVLVLEGWRWLRVP